MVERKAEFPPLQTDGWRKEGCVREGKKRVAEADELGLEGRQTLLPGWELLGRHQPFLWGSGR